MEKESKNYDCGDDQGGWFILLYIPNVILLEGLGLRWLSKGEDPWEICKAFFRGVGNWGDVFWFATILAVVGSFFLSMIEAIVISECLPSKKH